MLYITDLNNKEKNNNSLPVYFQIKSRLNYLMFRWTDLHLWFIDVVVVVYF